MNIETSILDQMKSAGFRITKARKSIVNIFLKSETPLSAYELLSSLKKKNINVNKTTVYREIDFFKDRKFIREIQLGDGLRKYEVRTGNHHHHIICVGCNRVECVELDRCLESEERKVSHKSNFRIFKHSIKFFGLCAECQ